MPILRPYFRSMMQPAMRALGDFSPGGSPVPPGGWTPIQQIPGWTLNYLVPLGDGIVDEGDAWVATDHEVTGLDASIYILGLEVRMPAAIASFPLRINFESFEDNMDVPGVNRLIETSTSLVCGGAGPYTHANGDPPTSSYAGSPFTHDVEVLPNGGQQAATSFYFIYQPPTATDAGPATTVSFEVRIEIESESNVWELIQDTDWTWVFDSGNMVDTGITFTVTDVDYTTVMIFNARLPDVERETVPVRITMLSYAITPEVGQEGTYLSAPILRLSNTGSVAELVGQEFWPQNAFPGTPWTVAVPAIITPFMPADYYYFSIQSNDAGFENTPEAGQSFSYRLVIEAQLP